MILYPAIDLIGGQCVRLYQGDFDIQKTYSKAPLDVASGYANAGAAWIHVVDLDGARDPQRRQVDLIKVLAQEAGAKIQSGGGMRSMDDVKRLLDCGVARVVIGSLAVRDPQVVRDAIAAYGPDAICIAVDVKPDVQNSDRYNVAISGWQEDGNIEVRDLLRDYEGSGLAHILCTDIARDGTMAGSNISLYRSLKREFPQFQIQASGGIGALDDLIHLHDSGADGVIVGKALYEGKFTIDDALQVVSC